MIVILEVLLLNFWLAFNKQWLDSKCRHFYEFPLVWYSLWGRREYQRQKLSSNDLNVIYFLPLDTYPPQKHTRLYPAIIILWYTFGLTWITLMFDLFSKILEKTKKTLTCNTLSQTEETSSTKTSFFWALSEQSERESQTSLVK